MVNEAQEKKNLRLNNWHLYLLGKLNEKFSKAELCDITLRFQADSNVVIRAHRVVLSSCTAYFDSLPYTPTGVTVNLPDCFSPSHVKSVINFVYTGKLEYRAEEKHIIVDSAKRLGMSVLIELLQVPDPKSTAPATVPPVVEKPTAASQDALIKQYITKHTRRNPAKEQRPSPTVKKIPVIPVASTTTHDVMVVSGPPEEVPDDTPTLLPGKKLPFWKKRTIVQQLPDEIHRSGAVINKPPPVVETLRRPTRFDWTEEDVLSEMEHSFSTIDTFEDLSYDTKVTVLKPPSEPKPIVSDVAVIPVPSNKGMQGIKRARVSEVVRGRIEDDDDYDDGHFETIHDLDDDYDDDSTTPSINSEHLPAMTPPKPILKTQASPSPSKRVRFSFSGTKADQTINKEKDSFPVTHTSVYSKAPQTTSQRPSSVEKIEDPASTQVTSVPVDPGKPLDIRKIANEVIKKFPDMLKQRKNIMLRIPMPSETPNSSSDPDQDGKVPEKPKMKVVVIKSDSIKQEPKNIINMGAENRTGPWFCVHCANEQGPMDFNSYYDYRKHLQEVHNERIDARICEHCGFKASKRNLHLYHLYTKHNIAPPRSIHFPKCDQCNYIALSESLLIKHRMNHTGLINKEYVCRICNAAFKSNGALMGHMQTNLHQVDHAAKKDYECEYCGKIFNRNINLKAHVRTTHQEETIRKMYEEEDRVDDPEPVEVQPEERNDNLIEVIEVPVYDSVQNANKALYLPQGMTILAEAPNMPLMPSSESEAMNNVATGIATSINLTDRNISNDVIVIDGHPELILQGSQATYVLNQDGSYSLQEYIVPEIMNDTGQVFTTALVSSAQPTSIGFVNSDNISIITSPSDHTYADEVKINGHMAATSVSLTAPSGTTVITTAAQEVQPVIMQEPIIVSGDWVQSISTSQASQNMNLGQGQKVEIISAPLFQGEQKVEIISASSSHQPRPVVEVQRNAQKLVSDWGDGDGEEEQEEVQDNENDMEVKPSRPTIDLEAPCDGEHY